MFPWVSPLLKCIHNLFSGSCTGTHHFPKMQHFFFFCAICFREVDKSHLPEPQQPVLFPAERDWKCSGWIWSSAVCAVIPTWSPTHTIYTAVRERGDFSKHALSDELCSHLLSKLRIGKTAEPWSHFILSHQKENILLKLLEINRFSWRFFPSV